MGRPDKIVEAGPKVEGILTGWMCESSGYHQLDPASVLAKRYHLLMGGNGQRFFVASRWSWAGNEDGEVDRDQGVWQFQWLALVYFLTTDMIHFHILHDIPFYVTKIIFLQLLPRPD